MDKETRKKISRTMKGHSNFEGHKHTHASKIAIATSQEGHRNAADHKWAVNSRTGKETRIKGGNLPAGNRWGRTQAFKTWIQKEDKQLFEAKNVKNAVADFTEFVQQYLNLDTLPQIDVIEDPKAAKAFGAFGGYYPEERRIELFTAGRHTMDVLRTLAHELVHYKQGLQEELPEDAGVTGSPYENEANAVAGKIMREYGQAYRDLFMEDKSSANRLEGTKSLDQLYKKETPGQRVRYTKIENTGTSGTVPASIDAAQGNIGPQPTHVPRIRKPIHSQPGTRKFYKENRDFVRLILKQVK